MLKSQDMIRCDMTRCVQIPRLGEDKFKLGHTKFEHVWETVDLSGAVREGRGRLVGFEIGTEISRCDRAVIPREHWPHSGD